MLSLDNACYRAIPEHLIDASCMWRCYTNRLPLPFTVTSCFTGLFSLASLQGIARTSQNCEVGDINIDFHTMFLLVM